jgi:prepilin-type N-terminal cleavage/methylation domain-containing protein/prepilin-type processing-associated H-X9-DG protein
MHRCDSFHRRRSACRRGFTLLELLIVIGIIALLIALLMPSLNRARAHAKSVQCQSNLHQIGQNLLIYANQWKGWIYPPEMTADNDDKTKHWPVEVFKPAIWNPKILLCPADFEPDGEHSYILNYHLYLKNIKYQTKLAGIPSTEVVVMGEKRSDRIDYYMTVGEYDDRVDPYRHGTRLGSNYLFLDLHVGMLKRKESMLAIDPWDPPVDPVLETLPPP